MSDSQVVITPQALLKHWQGHRTLTRRMNKLPAGRFQETDTAFGQWTMPVYDLLLYIIDNELHHRGQGYVYLRALGIDPPPFYERA